MLGSKLVISAAITPDGVEVETQIATTVLSPAEVVALLHGVLTAWSDLVDEYAKVVELPLERLFEMLDRVQTESTCSDASRLTVLRPLGAAP